MLRFSAAVSGGGLLAAVVALAFAGHPLTEDVVPATARSIDLLLAVATFWALLALSCLHERGWRGWVAFLGAVALALGTKETAVLLLPLSALWVLLFRLDLPRQCRVRAALRVAAPVAVLVGAWLVLRAWVLGGFGGYYESVRPEWVWSALERAFVEPFVPTLSAFAPRGWRTLVPTALTWVVLLRWGWHSPHRRLVLFAAAWFLGATAIHVATGTLSRRVYYVLTLPACLLVLPALIHASCEPRRRLAGSVIGLAWALAFVHGSPAVFRYRQWPEISRASEVYRDASFWSAVPAGTRVWLLERPFRADLDPRTFRFWGGRGRSLHHGAPAYAVEAWLAEVMPERKLEVETLTGTAFTAPLAAQRVDWQQDGGRLVVRRQGADRQRWPVRGPFAADSDGETVTVYPREPTDDRVVLWTPDGLVLWPSGP